MQLDEKPFLAIEPESQHPSALAAISLACVLLVAIKGNALLQYWQQTHHIFLELGNLPTASQLIPGSQTFAHWQQDFNRWGDERAERMLVAGQLLLAGDKALPKPQVVMAPTKCPEVATPKATAPTCPAPATNEKPTAEPSKTSVPVVANINIAPSEKKEAKTVDTTESPSTTDDPAFVMPEATPEALAAANAPIALQTGDRILLVGDSLMQGVAPHLITALKRNYNVESMDISRHSTGLTYPAFFDWPATVKAAFELENYQVVIVFLGANDPWDMTLQGKYVRYGSERWREVYSARVKQIIQTTAEHNARLIWLGAPPMGREDLLGKEPLLNEIYATESARYPLFARFVATAPSLSTDGSTFTKFLELPERGSVMVRTDDGVHFTTQGQKLLAKLTLAQFTHAAPSTEQPPVPPMAEPGVIPAEPKPTASPAPVEPTPPAQQPNPAISQR
ncbi:SGNH/GDSL hydrolase family protein [Cellvibrio mixtus]|uniref:SGNH/GDSL hydrolase family protein n=1 Tax=Cellvibrio mixtus TaxID=39650 RepID=UPI00058750F1|nr:DUF459 domain-containing protein [Cellvibrio mixtus]